MADTSHDESFNCIVRTGIIWMSFSLCHLWYGIAWNVWTFFGNMYFSALLSHIRDKNSWLLLRNLNSLTVATFVLFLPKTEASKGINIWTQLRNKIAMRWGTSLNKAKYHRDDNRCALINHIEWLCSSPLLKLLSWFFFLSAGKSYTFCPCRI